MTIKKTVVGIATAAAITGAIVLADTVVFNPPAKAPVSSATLEYVAPPQIGQDFTPTTPPNEDTDSVLPQETPPAKNEDPPKAEPPTHGSTLYFPPRDEKSINSLNHILHQTIYIEPDPDALRHEAFNKKKEAHIMLASDVLSDVIIIPEVVGIDTHADKK